MRYWRTDYSVPFPGATGAYVHTGGSAHAWSCFLELRACRRWPSANQFHVPPAWRTGPATRLQA